MMKLIKNNIGEIIAFLSAIILLMFGFEISGLFKYSAIISDLRTEVYPLLEHLKNGFLMLICGCASFLQLPEYVDMEGDGGGEGIQRGKTLSALFGGFPVIGGHLKQGMDVTLAFQRDRG